MRRSTASAEGAELTGQAHGAEREERGARGNGSATGDPGLRDRERERGSARGRKLELICWPHWAASEGGRARARARGLAGLSGPAWLLSLFLFLWIY